MNIGGRKIKLVAKDDAELVTIVRVEDIATGTYAMPFGHVWFLLDYYSIIGHTDYCTRFAVLFDLSRIRNRRIMRKVNEVLAHCEGKELFDLDNMVREIDIEQIKREAEIFGIDTSKYLNEENDADDVAQCTTPWCLDQLTEPGKASDNVQIITDLDGVDWIVLIVRKFGPGRNDLALAGGFVDPGETFEVAAAREKNEETEVELSGSYATGGTNLDTVFMMDWDPRAKFPHGMMVFARVTHHVFIK